MNNKYYKYNARLTRQSYGSLHCTNCGNRLAFIKNKNYKYLYFVFVCNCGSEVVFLNDYDGPKTKDNYYVDIKNNIVICKRCNCELFYIDKRKFINFAFHIICNCGKEYNRLFKGHKK